MSEIDTHQEYKGSRTLSKKKYYEILDALSECYGEADVSKISGVIKHVMRFDPTISLYDDKAKESIKLRRERLKTEGVSTYESSGAKSFYHKNKKIT